MAQAIIKTILEIADPIRPVNSPSILEFTKSFPYTKKFHQIYDIAVSTSINIWTGASEPASGVQTFDFAIFIVNGNVDIEFTANDGDANEELDTKRVIKNVPLILGADDSYYNHSASDAFGGTIDIIDKIRANNPSSTETVGLEVFLGKN